MKFDDRLLQPLILTIFMKKTLAAITLLFVLTGCSGLESELPVEDSEKPAVNMEPQTPPELTEAQKAQLEAGDEDHEVTTLTFDVVGGMFYFVPNDITVKKGDTVKINFINAGGFHDFVLDEFDVKTAQINGGETASVEFVADKVGIFEFYCSVGSHRQMGQKGVFTVEGV